MHNPIKRTLPPPATTDPQQTVREYWLRRAAQHTLDSYMGVPIAKFPEDLRVYEHLLFGQRPQVVIEVGTQYGGSALWFRDRLRTLESYGLIRDPLVISIDLVQNQAPNELASVDTSYADSIRLIEADITEPGLSERIATAVPSGANCFVVEDSAHRYETTKASLMELSQFVPPGGYFVVEDTCVDIDDLRLADDWPRGVLPAVADWLSGPQGGSFRVAKELELYGVTCHPGGFLQRTV